MTLGIVSNTDDMGRHAMQLSTRTTSGYFPNKAVSPSPSLNSLWNKYPFFCSTVLNFLTCSAGAYATPRTQTSFFCFCADP
jgi:hypothetical protein